MPWKGRSMVFVGFLLLKILKAFSNFMLKEYRISTFARSVDGNHLKLSRRFISTLCEMLKWK